MMLDARVGHMQGEAIPWMVGVQYMNCQHDICFNWFVVTLAARNNFRRLCLLTRTTSSEGSCSLVKQCAMCTFGNTWNTWFLRLNLGNPFHLRTGSRFSMGAEFSDWGQVLYKQIRKSTYDVRLLGKSWQTSCISGCSTVFQGGLLICRGEWAGNKHSKTYPRVCQEQGICQAQKLAPFLGACQKMDQEVTSSRTQLCKSW